jgi:hypothetical protein
MVKSIINSLAATGAMRLPIRWNFNNVNAVLEVLIEAAQMITITMQILPQQSASAAYSVSAQYETAVSFLRIPNVDWWSLYWKLALVVAFSLLSSLIFVEVRCFAAIAALFPHAPQNCNHISAHVVLADNSSESKHMLPPLLRRRFPHLIILLSRSFVIHIKHHDDVYCSDPIKRLSLRHINKFS